MRKKRLLFCIAIVVMLLLNAVPAYATSSDKSKDSKILLVSIPRVSWEQLKIANTKNIDKLINKGSVANLNTRVNDKHTLEKAYATISAGSSTSAVASTSSTFFSPTETFNSIKSKDIFTNERGAFPESASGLSLGFELNLTLKENVKNNVQIGAFGEALQKDNKSIAVFGNADPCATDRVPCLHRPVGYLGANKNGVLLEGDVSRDLLNDDMKMDMNILEKKTIKSIDENDVTALECSDVERLERTRNDMSQEVYNQEKLKAIQSCDSLVGNLVKHLDLEKDRIYIISPTSIASTLELTVFIAAGKGIEPGYAKSAITRRSAMVSLSDIAPSILDFFEVRAPSSMTPTLVEYNPSSDTLLQKQNRLIEVNQQSLIRDKSFNLVATFFVVSVFVIALFSLLAFKKYPKLKTIVQGALLFSMAMPTVSFLLLAFMVKLETPFLILIAFVGLSAAYAFALHLLATKVEYVKVVLAIFLLNILMLIGDIYLSGELQLNSLFGYSAITGGRFAGFGNLAFSIVTISAIGVVAMVKELYKAKQDTKYVNLALMGFLALVLISVGSPYAGSDVGGVLALTPAIVLTALMLYEKQITIKSFFLASLVTFVVISLFSLLDLSRPVSQRTHLGRFIEDLLSGDWVTVIERKLVSSFNILTNSVIASVVIFITLCVFAIFSHPEKHIRQITKQSEGIKYLVYPGMLAALLGMLVNDSGVAIPGMMFAIGFPAAMILIFDLKSLSESAEVEENV